MGKIKLFTDYDYDISKKYHDSHYANGWLLAVKSRPNDDLRSCFRFPIIKGISNITKATLFLYNSNNCDGRTYTINRIIDGFEDATWDDPPTITTDNQVDFVTPAQTGWWSIDITDLFKDESSTYFAIQIKDSVEGASPACINEFYSKEHAGNKDDQLYSYIEVEGTISPTISSISWSPAGDYETLRSGTTLTGDTENLLLVGTDPDYIDGLSAGEAMLQIGEGDPFTVKEYDHFRFDNKEWWVLNIICGPECDFITLADENAEAEREPKIGDKIEFAAAIDWHDKEVSTIKWYYAKAPDECFEKDDLEWVLFATDTDMPAYTFDDDGDEDITFFRVTATNKDGDIGEFDTLCGPIFNLWKKPGFDENWLVGAFMAYILPGLAEKFEYLSDLVFDGEAESTSGGFSLSWSPTEFVEWIAEELAGVAEDILDIVFGTPEEEETSGFSVLWSPAEFVAWLYKSVAAMAEDILDLVFKED